MFSRTQQALAVAALLLTPSAAGPPPDLGATRATLALVDELPANARALLILRAGTGDGVILLRRSDATVTDLAAALALLDRSRHNETVPLARDRQVVLQTASIARPLSDRARQHLTTQLARLRHAPPREVAGVGSVPTIELRLPRRPH